MSTGFPDLDPRPCRGTRPFLSSGNTQRGVRGLLTRRQTGTEDEDGTEQLGQMERGTSRRHAGRPRCTSFCRFSVGLMDALL